MGNVSLVASCAMHAQKTSRCFQVMKSTASEAEIDELKEALNEMILAKQCLTNELYTTRLSNVKFAKKLDRQRDYFLAKDEALQLEMKQIKSTLQSMKRSLQASNGKLVRHLRRCAGTRFRLGTMFLRMRSTKRWHEKRRNRYQQMCFQFAAYVQEQNRYMQAIVHTQLSCESITTSHRQYFDLLTRCSQLLHENMNLRLLFMNKLDDNRVDSPGKSETTPYSDIAEDEKIFESGSEETIFSISAKSSMRQRSKSV
ncbi:uncharacterized protein LOC131693320 [Topomyia yanbarensis]|uniref:uncharacterized protein LOC131693320 n=1 Tax=Topomyia yanbarensis TaxID=2498891 RepID=UPI00273ADA4E|nr:uncharacterized protein LOC131693320 [Topomyia yanbarensis]